jgi:hypothetical protein
VIFVSGISVDAGLDGLLVETLLDTLREIDSPSSVFGEPSVESVTLLRKKKDPFFCEVVSESIGRCGNT